MSVDPQIKFKRARKGYDPQEVDAVFSEMQRQIDDLKQQNRTLSNTVTQFNEKIKQFETNTQLVEQERVKASLRVSGVLDKAVRIAEETEREARQKYDEMIKAAQSEAQSISDRVRTDTEAARNALTNVSRALPGVRQNNQQFYRNTESSIKDLDTLLNEALNEIPVIPPAAPFSEPQTAAMQVPDPTDFDYDQFLKDAGLEKPDFTKFRPGRDQIIGQFGD